MWWSNFSRVEHLRVSREWWSPVLILKTLRDVRKSCSPFFSIKNFKSHEKVMESFFGIKNVNTVLSVPTEFLWLYISLTIHLNLHEERCRTRFSKYSKSYFPTTQINGFTYILSETAVPSFRSYSCSELFWKYCGNFTFNWIFVLSYSVK